MSQAPHPRQTWLRACTGRPLSGKSDRAEPGKPGDGRESRRIWP